MSMIEKVARALCALDGYDWEALGDPMKNPNGDDDGEEYYLGLARAAIEAMREPT